MDVAKIRRAGRGLESYLAEFSDCFGRCDTESYLAVYVAGQNSDLQRKSAEPIALRAGQRAPRRWARCHPDTRSTICTALGSRLHPRGNH